MMRALAILLLVGCQAAERAAPAEPVEEPPDTGEPEPGPISCVGGVPCDGACVDTSNDPRNCGGCGRACVAIRGVAACASGQCVIERCDQGYANCDGALANGCERLIDCVEGASCGMACGVQGALSCADPCAPTCLPLAERCNGADDDCDGACDEGSVPGCRVGVHRASGAQGHLFTNDLASASAWGTLEAANFFYLYADATADLRPLFSCPKGNGNSFLSYSSDCDGTGPPAATLGFVAPPPGAGAAPTCGAVPLYHLHHDGQNWDFYTLSTAEVASAAAAGWVERGIRGYVWLAP